MKLNYFPLLQTQRELQGLPRDDERFRTYLRTMIGHYPPIVQLPSLNFANPMAKEHVTELLDEYLALDADGIAARALADATPELADVPGEYTMTLVVADDLKGGWTNRYDYEFMLRGPYAAVAPEAPLPKWVDRAWLAALLWSSEPASARAVREAVLAVVYRAAYVQQYGYASTLRDFLAQEGAVMARAGCVGPVLDEEDIDYTREVLKDFQGADDKRTIIECLFGDPAGQTLGFAPRGLSHWAGLALALHDARAHVTV